MLEKGVSNVNSCNSLAWSLASVALNTWPCSPGRVARSAPSARSLRSLASRPPLLRFAAFALSLHGRRSVAHYVFSCSGRRRSAALLQGGASERCDFQPCNVKGISTKFDGKKPCPVPNYSLGDPCGFPGDSLRIPMNSLRGSVEIPE